MLGFLQPLQLKDPKRRFGPLEREIIYFRDKKICARCDAPVAWDEAEIHHIKEHQDGGPTVLPNGALVHKHCHPKGSAVKAFAASNLEQAASESELKSRASRKIKYEMNGRAYEAKNAKVALLQILEHLSRGDPRFFERLAPRVAERARNHIAARKEDVYPNRPDLAENATEVLPGWWIGLNIANREKRRILECACEVAGVRFGHDLKIDLPNA